MSEHINEAAIEADTRDLIEHLADDQSWWEGMFDDTKLPEGMSDSSIRWLMRRLHEGWVCPKQNPRMADIARDVVEETITVELNKQGVFL